LNTTEIWLTEVDGNTKSIDLTFAMALNKETYEISSMRVQSKTIYMYPKYGI